MALKDSYVYFLYTIFSNVIINTFFKVSKPPFCYLLKLNKSIRGLFGPTGKDRYYRTLEDGLN